MIISDQKCCLDTAFTNEMIQLYKGWAQVPEHCQDYKVTMAAAA